MKFRTACLALLVLAACTPHEPAAAMHTIALDSANASVPGLDFVSSVAELPDGRLVIAQPGVPSVLVADFATGALDTLGRAGDGPGEYRHPMVALAYRGEAGILDPQSQRFTFWNAEGKPDSITTVAVLPSWTVALDTLGNLYAEQPSTAGFILRGQDVDSTGPKDSTWIYRLHPPASGRDTVGRLHEVGWAVLPFKEGVARRRRLYQSADQWGVLPDGRMWILRGEQNRVDRRAADGTWSAGAPRPWTGIKVTDGDRIRINFPWARGSDTMDFPMVETKGPYQETAVAAADGEVWAMLNRPAGDSVVQYELFPGKGASTGTVVLPPGRKVIAVGRQAVYAVREDEDGFYIIERYRRP